MPPHEYYEKFIAPYKGELELWYNKNKGFVVDLLIIFLTAWVILFPGSQLVHRIFKDLPKKSI
jgi:lipopolysaccharide/colanic/teichoic acid biosynthesis glycosyltransferase